nr:MAG TPA: hypothetical protein [Caudoviricetes sp.]DAX88909.1 MAG TPA: hypothetical protein [Caudoviricetes sp.]
MKRVLDMTAGSRMAHPLLRAHHRQKPEGEQ